MMARTKGKAEAYIIVIVSGEVHKFLLFLGQCILALFVHARVVVNGIARIPVTLILLPVGGPGKTASHKHYTPTTEKKSRELSPRSLFAAFPPLPASDLSRSSTPASCFTPLLVEIPLIASLELFQALWSSFYCQDLPFV